MSKLPYYRTESKSSVFYLAIGFGSVIEIHFKALYCGDYGLTCSEKKAESLFVAVFISIIHYENELSNWSIQLI